MPFRVPVDTQEPIQIRRDPPTQGTFKRISPVEPIAFNTTTWVEPPEGFLWEIDAIETDLFTSAVVGNRCASIYWMDVLGNTASYACITSAASFVNRHFASKGGTIARASALEAISTGPFWSDQCTHPCRIGVRFHGFDDPGDIRHFYVFVREVRT